MIYLTLFLTFLEIGAVSFGGGYAMISLIREAVISHGWLTEGELMNFIAVSESTPGPIAINMATFVGSSQGGLFGSFCATLGVVLPSFVIILIIAAVLRNFLKYKPVGAFLGGVRPCVIGLILSVGVSMFLSTLFAFKNTESGFTPSVRGIVIFAVVAISAALYKRWKKKSPSPILLIVFSAILGAGLYSI